MNKSLLTRRIDVQLALDGDTFDGSNNQISVTGLRCQLTIQSYSGLSSGHVSQLQMRLSGMKPADIAKLSTLGFIQGQYKKNAINILAGDDQSGMSQVFTGGITYGNVDYNSMPDVGLEIIASATANTQYDKIAASSYKGDVQAASIVAGIAQAAGFGFSNNGVTAVLSNHAVGGSTKAQLDDVCEAAGCLYKIENKTVVIWPAGGSAGDSVIDLSPATGLVGYPRYIVAGLEVKSIFNPAFRLGRLIKISSSIPSPTGKNPVTNGTLMPGANGTFVCQVLTHDLSAQMPDGPWFSTMQVFANTEHITPAGGV